jgi:hypothetical protein
MFQLVVIAGIAFGSEAVDGIFKKSGSCSGGSCSAVPAKVESKPAPKVENSTKVESSCKSSCSASEKIRGRANRLLNRLR